MAIRKLEHVGVFVRDMQKSVKFYRDILGLEVKYTVSLGEDNELVFLAAPGAEETLIELVPLRGSELAEVGLVHHIAFTVDDLDAEYERLRAHGVEFMDEQPNRTQNGGKYIFFYGPDKEHLELFQPTP